jgi:Flp pilus assembly protein CpaB
MLVDVLVTLPTGDGGSSGSGGKGATGQITKVLLENIKVIAADGNNGGASGQSYSSKHNGEITLSVTPDQAEKLVLANEIGKFHLLLRSFTDTKNAKIPPVDYDELLTGIKPTDLEKALPAPPKGVSIKPVTPGQGLPEPAGPEAKSGHQMEIYTGSGVKTVKFDN